MSDENVSTIDEALKVELEAGVFRKLLSHLDGRKDVQNIELMNLAGFCRNCLAKWYVAEAEGKGVTLEYDQVREMIYGMPYSEWKDKYQTPASEEQQQRFAESREQKKPQG